MTNPLTAYPRGRLGVVRMKEEEFEAILNFEIEGIIYKPQRNITTGMIEIEKWKLVRKFGQSFTISHDELKNGLVNTYQRSLDQFNYGTYFITKEDAIKSSIDSLKKSKENAIKRINTIIADLEKLLSKEVKNNANTN